MALAPPKDFPRTYRSVPLPSSTPIEGTVEVECYFTSFRRRWFSSTNYPIEDGGCIIPHPGDIRDFERRWQYVREPIVEATLDLHNETCMPWSKVARISKLSLDDPVMWERSPDQWVSGYTKR